MRKQTWTKSNVTMIENAFCRETLASVCEMPESAFGEVYDLERFDVPEQKAPNDFYYYKDNGSDILFVAHLDTVGKSWEREAHYLETEGGLVVYSRALDDRLGAYIGLEWLPALGITYDWLLTVGEETGQSTAYYFDPPKKYKWIIEFDRGGTDVVLYEYGEGDSGKEAADLVKDSGARVGEGIFSDICYLEHLGVKGFNWGVGYRDYHGPRAHAYLEDTFMMLSQYLRFHEANAETTLPHVKEDIYAWTDEEEERWWESYQASRGLLHDDVWDDDEDVETVVAALIATDDESAHGEDEYAAMKHEWKA